MPTAPKIIDQLFQNIIEDPKPENWLTLGGYLIEINEWETLINLFHERQKQSSDGISLFLSLLMHPRVVNDKKNRTNLINISSFELASPYHILLWFVSGCANICFGNIARGRDIFNDIIVLSDTSNLNLEDLPYLSVLRNAYDQLYEFDDVEEILSSNEKHFETEINYLSQKDTLALTGENVFLAACNQTYFDLFAQGFFDAFKEEGLVHIHVVNGDKERMKVFEVKNDSPYLSLSTETYDGLENSPFYASLRFLRAKEIMEYYQRNLIIADVDTAYHKGLDRMISKSSEGDIGIFKSDNIVPWYHNMVTGMFIKYSKMGLIYLDVFGKSLGYALKKPTWYIDQSVCLSVNHYFQKTYGDGPLQYLRQKDGFYAQDIFKPAAEEPEKAKLRVGIETRDY